MEMSQVKISFFVHMDGGKSVNVYIYISHIYIIYSIYIYIILYIIVYIYTCIQLHQLQSLVHITAKN